MRYITAAILVIFGIVQVLLHPSPQYTPPPEHPVNYEWIAARGAKTPEPLSAEEEAKIAAIHKAQIEHPPISKRERHKTWILLAIFFFYTLFKWLKNVPFISALLFSAIPPLFLLGMHARAMTVGIIFFLIIAAERFFGGESNDDMLYYDSDHWSDNYADSDDSDSSDSDSGDGGD